MTHGHYRFKRRPIVYPARRCATCGGKLSDLEDYEHAACARAWKRATRAPGFLPTVELELFGEAGCPAPLAEPDQGELFREE